MINESLPYRALCTEFYDLDKPNAPEDALKVYLKYAEEANGPILEPMCGTGRYLIPLLQKGFSVTGFDSSSYMLNKCLEKCEGMGLSPILHEATFETFSSPELYSLIFIPCGSFCLLIPPKQIAQSLSFIANRLVSGGKFIFEVIMLTSVSQSQGEWSGKWIDRSDGSKIVLSTLSRFDSISKVGSSLCRYELWEGNSISQTEVEDFQIRYYEPKEIESLLNLHGLRVVGKWEAEPHTHLKATGDTPVILYECLKV